MASRTDNPTWTSGTIVTPETILTPDLPKVRAGRDAKKESLAWSARFGRLAQALRRVLSRPRAAWGVVAVALLLTSPALTLDFTLDDHLHTMALRTDSAFTGFQRAPWDLFAFAKDPVSNTALMEDGVFAWWSDPEVQISFFRPLSSLTHVLDHRLWPEQPALMHLHNLLWFAALLLVIHRVYRQHTASAWVATFALLIFAADDARAVTVGWLSNRNALVALTFGFGAVALHHRWRAEGRPHWGALSALLFGMGLLGAEAATSVVGYLAAYALCLETGSLRRRLTSLLPYLGILVAWRIMYVSLGYGAFGSEFYIDPGRSPLLFAQKLMVRLPVLLLAEFAVPSADLWDAYSLFAPGMRSVIPVVGLVALGLLAWLLWPLARADARIRFWCLGTLLSTIPVCGATPNDRLLTATGVGGAALVSALLASFVERSYPSAGRVQRVLVGCLAVVHLALGPLLLPARTKAVDAMEDLITYAAASVPSAPSVRQETVVLLNPPAEHFAAYFPVYREAKGIPRPKEFRWLATGITAMDIERIDAHSLALRPEGGFLENDVQWFLRSRERHFGLHQKIELEGMTIEITALTEDFRPAEVLARFDEPLESPKLRFLRWGEHEYVPWELPKVGERVHVPAIDLMNAFFGDLPT